MADDPALDTVVAAVAAAAQAHPRKPVVAAVVEVSSADHHPATHTQSQ